MESNTVGFFKRSDKLKIDEVNMRTWLLLAWSEAAKSDIYKSYSPDSCLLAATDIAKAANENTLTVTGLKDILNNNGIIFCHIPQLDSAPIYAYSVMVGENPAIVVTYRHNMDKLAFYVLHEIGHIRQHLNSGKSYISVENDYSSQSPEEKEADEFANNILIPPAVWKSIMSVGSKNLTPYTIVHIIAAEAKKHGMSPTIAISRYKHDTRCYAVRSYRSPKIS